MARTKHPMNTKQGPSSNNSPRPFTFINTYLYSKVHCRLGYLHRRQISWKSRKQFRGGPLHNGMSHTEHLARVRTARVPSLVRRPKCLQTRQYFCFPCKLSETCIRLSSINGTSDCIFILTKSSAVNWFSISTSCDCFPANWCWSPISSSPFMNSVLINIWPREWSTIVVVVFDAFSCDL